MPVYEYNEIYCRLIREWSKMQQQSEFQSFYPKFIEQLKKETHIPISYDTSICETIEGLLEKFEFLAFDIDLYKNQKREKLFYITQILQTKGFIGKRQRTAIMVHQNVCLKNKILQLQQITKDLEIRFCSAQELKFLWVNIIQTQISTFWSYIEQYKINHPILMQIYEMSNIIEPNLIANLIVSRLYATYRRNVPQIVIPAFQIENQNNNMKPQRKIIEQFPQRFESAQNIEKFDYQKWFISQKYLPMLNHLSQIDKKPNEILKQLTKIAFQKSLMFNREHQYLLNNIKAFIKSLKTILEDVDKIQYIDLFGSLRSSLALVSEYDIDITMVTKQFFSRKQKENLLFSIRRHLQKESVKPTWLKSAIIMCSRNIPVPFIKLVLDDAQIQRLFSLENITKIDITIGNKSAIINSELFSRFAEKIQILMFCLIIKLWAKSVKLINIKFPMQGLSGYGLMLMCIYYLMYTNQIDYLNPDNYNDFQSFTFSKVGRCEMKDLDQNFLDFLIFYGEKGIFQKKMLMVSLIRYEDLPIPFNDDVIVNMYDFIDGTNPGRLKINSKDFFFGEFQKAKNIMQSKDLAKIKTLFRPQIQ